MRTKTILNVSNAVNKIQKDMENISSYASKKGFTVNFSEDREITSRLAMKYAGIYKINKLQYNYNTVNYCNDLNAIITNEKRILEGILNTPLNLTIFYIK